MGLFKPKAPKRPETTEMHFHFASDRLPPPVVPVSMEVAIARIQSEIRKLRAAVEGGNKTRTVGKLQPLIEDSQAKAKDAAGRLSAKQRAAYMGAATAQDIASIQAEFNTHSAMSRSLLDERQKREAADKANAELTTILQAIQ